jgi:hypothetical protein
MRQAGAGVRYSLRFFWSLTLMSPKPIATNTLFYGDNLPILREYLPDESVDLIYLDPPFNSQRSAL